MGELKEIKGTLEKIIYKIDSTEKRKISLVWNNEFKNYSKHTQLIELEKGKLKIYVDSSVWMQQLNLSKKLIMHKINEYLKKKTIKEVQFIIGEINYS